MKFTTGLLALGLGLAASGAIAQSAAPAVGAEKKAALDGVLPNLYGEVEMRHTTNRTMADDEIVKTRPNFAVRPKLGSTFFDGKVDTYLIGIYSKRPETNKVEKSVLFNETYFNLWEGANGSSFKPYAYTELPTEGYTDSKNKTWVGFEALGLLPVVENAAGVVELRALVYHLGVFNVGDGQDKVTAENNTGDPTFSLAPEGEPQDLTVNQREPGMENWSEFGIRFKPAAVQGLLVAVYSELDTSWTPKYEFDEDGDVEQNGYALGKGTINKFTLSYKVSDKLTVYNSLRQYLNGYWEAGTDETATRWQNRLGLMASLF